ncbi:hypothetical protein [Microbacterium lacticum]
MRAHASGPWRSRGSARRRHALLPGWARFEDDRRVDTVSGCAHSPTLKPVLASERELGLSEFEVSAQWRLGRPDGRAAVGDFAEFETTFYAVPNDRNLLVGIK